MTRAKLMQGNEACVLGALAAGVSFFAGYPITPSTEITEVFSRKLPKAGGIFMQMEDEIASIAAVIGASCTGRKALTATSGPGFSLKQENIGFAAIAEIPCTIVNIMRVGPSTGMPTISSQGDVMQARWGTHGDHPVIVLSPNSVDEIYHEIIRGVGLSEKYRVPVIILIDEIIGHLRERVETDVDNGIKITDRKRPVPGEDFLPFENTGDGIPPFADFGMGYRYHITGLMHDEAGFPTINPEVVDKFVRRLNGKLDKHYDDIVKVAEVETADADILIVAYGCVSRSAEEATARMRKSGRKVGLMRPVTLWPFPEKEIYKAASGKKAVIVPEMNMGQFVREVERVFPDKDRVFPLNRVDGRIITPQQIIDLVEEIS
jgi:2-oxoglutarate ferredoxin oxidoreductase subunit alpha